MSNFIHLEENYVLGCNTGIKSLMFRGTYCFYHQAFFADYFMFIILAWYAHQSKFR
jgi:hypothetical protein